MTAYGEMPTPVRRLFKHTHLHTACRLLGVSSISLEYLPNSEPCSPVAAAASAGADEYPKGWAAGPPKNSFASALDHPSSSATAAGNAPMSSGTPPGGVGDAGEGQQAQFQEVGRRNGWVGSPADARERRTSAGRKAGVGDKGETSATAATAITEAVAATEEVPFAVMRGVDVEQERWEVSCSIFCALCRIGSSNGHISTWFFRAPRFVMTPRKCQAHLRLRFEGTYECEICT